MNSENVPRGLLSTRTYPGDAWETIIVFKTRTYPGDAWETLIVFKINF